MFGVQNQAGVEHLGDGRRRLVLGEHVVEIGGVPEVVAGRDGVVAVAQAVEGGDDGRQLGDEPDDRVPVALGVGDVASGVEHAHRGDAGLEGVHRMAIFRQALHDVEQLVLDTAVMAQLIVEASQLALSGKVALEQQPGCLLETTLPRQGFHGDAAVFQAGPFAVDETDRRLGGRHVGQSRPILQLTHGVLTLN